MMGEFLKTKIGKKLIAKQFPFPPSAFVKNVPFLPYYFLGDSAFALSEFMITPFGKLQPNLFVVSIPEYEEIFNYRQSRSRRVIENSFGILVSVFRVFKTEIDMDVDNVDNLIMSTLCLHNFRLMENEKIGVGLPDGLVDREVDGVVIDGSWRKKNDTFDQINPLRLFGW